MDNSLQTQPTRQPWSTPQVYDLNSRRTESNATSPTATESLYHSDTSNNIFYGPMS